MVLLNPNVQVTTLNTDDLNAAIKKDCENELRNKTQLYTV